MPDGVDLETFYLSISISEGSPPHKKRKMRHGDTSLKVVRKCSTNSSALSKRQAAFDNWIWPVNFWGPLMKVPSELSMWHPWEPFCRFRNVHASPKRQTALTIEFGHSEGTFTIEKIWGPLIRVPSELPNCQRGVRESHFVIFVMWMHPRNGV